MTDEEFDKMIEVMNKMSDLACLPSIEDRLIAKGETLEEFKKRFLKMQKPEIESK